MRLLLLPALLLSACAPQPVSPAEDVSGPAAHSQDQAQAGASVTLSEGEIFVPLEGRDVTAGFGRFSSASGEVTLVGITAPFAQAVEMHTHSMDDEGRMAMRQVSSFTIPAGDELILARGGDHLMFFGVTPGFLVPDEEIELTAQLRRPDAEEETVTFRMKVRAR